MTPNELKSLLDKHGIRALKARSQHFLLDARVTEAMCEAAGVRPGIKVLEIGPGPGVLTDMLLARGAHVTAVELDARFTPLLQERFSERHLDLIEGDVLKVTNARLAAGSGVPYSLISNLPYAITSATLQKFLMEAPQPRSITLLIQKEVAERIIAQPKNMSQLAVLVQTLARPTKIMDVPAGAFLPPPKVQSAVIHMEVKTTAELAEFFGRANRKRYFEMVATAFKAPRKQLKNTLRSLIKDGRELESLLNRAKINPSSRPEELKIVDWQRLVTELKD